MKNFTEFNLYDFVNKMDNIIYRIIYEFDLFNKRFLFDIGNESNSELDGIASDTLDKH